jgi:hypothetical protein
MLFFSFQPVMAWGRPLVPAPAQLRCKQLAQLAADVPFVVLVVD